MRLLPFCLQISLDTAPQGIRSLMEQHAQKTGREGSNMASVPGPSFRHSEEQIWQGADDLGKPWCLRRWRTEMLAEASAHYSREMRVDVHITMKKVQLVVGKLPATLDPFLVDGQEDLVDEPIDLSRDARLVVLWAQQFPRKLKAIKSRHPRSYCPSKFRFFRRLHFRMEKTAEYILRYRQAKEEAQVLGYFEVGYNENFSFAHFVEDPDDYTTEAFEQSVASTLHLEEMDRQEAAEYEQQVEYPSTSSDEDE
jgi:hypothetical protein